MRSIRAAFVAPRIVKRDILSCTVVALLGEQVEQVYIVGLAVTVEVGSQRHFLIWRFNYKTTK